MHYILSTGTSIKPPSTSKKLGPWVHCLFMSCFYSVYFHISSWFPHVSTTSHRSTSNAFLADFLAHQSLNLYIYTLWYIGQTHGKFHVLEATDWGTSSINWYVGFQFSTFPSWHGTKCCLRSHPKLLTWQGQKVHCWFQRWESSRGKDHLPKKYPKIGREHEDNGVIIAISGNVKTENILMAEVRKIEHHCVLMVWP